MHTDTMKSGYASDLDDTAIVLADNDAKGRTLRIVGYVFAIGIGVPIGLIIGLIIALSNGSMMLC